MDNKLAAAGAAILGGERHNPNANKVPTGRTINPGNFAAEETSTHGKRIFKGQANASNIFAADEAAAGQPQTNSRYAARYSNPSSQGSGGVLPTVDDPAQRFGSGDKFAGQPRKLGVLKAQSGAQGGSERKTPEKEDDKNEAAAQPTRGYQISNVFASGPLANEKRTGKGMVSSSHPSGAPDMLFAQSDAASANQPSVSGCRRAQGQYQQHSSVAPFADSFTSSDYEIKKLLAARDKEHDKVAKQVEEHEAQQKEVAAARAERAAQVSELFKMQQGRK